MSKAVLVTGAKGFIGRNLVKKLKARGHTVTELDWPDDLREVREVVCDVVVHAAAIGGVGRAATSPNLVVSNNVECTTALRSAIETVYGSDSGYPPQVIQISSFSVYGDAPVPTTIHAPIAPKELYGASKYMQELCWTGYRGPLSILRLSSVYGPHMRIHDSEATVIAKIALAAHTETPFELFEDGLQERDFVHVGDVVAAVASLIHAGPFSAPDLLNVCSGKSVTLQHVCEVFGAKWKLSGRSRPGDMRMCKGDAHALETLLGRETTKLSKNLAMEVLKCAAF